VKSISKEVKLQKKVVDTIEIPQYESLEEIGKAMDEKLAVSLINRQIVTDATNTARANKRESAPGKAKRYALAFNLLPTVIFDDEESWNDKLISAGGDKEKLDALLNTKEVQAAVDANIGS